MTDLPAYQSSSANGPDPIPLLPRGDVVFGGLPLQALVMGALAPVIGQGVLVVRVRERGAVILVRDSAVAEIHEFGGDGSSTRVSALPDVQAWPDAVVSGHRFDASLIDVCESLVRGEILYTDLRLDWVEWAALLADFGRRGGAYAVEILTPAGRGVTCVVMGRQPLSYTDVHPEPCDPGVLESMAARKDGSIRVRRLNAAVFAATTVGADAPEHPTSATAAPSPDVRAGQPQPNAAGEHTNGVSPAEAPGAVDQDLPAPQSQRTAAADEVLPDLTWVAPWQTPWRDEPAPASAQPAGDDAPAIHLPVGAVLGDLRSIAQRRLQLSASRVETVLDEAAREDRSVVSVLEEIRAMSIRGVMPATVDAMVAEMSAAVVGHRPA